MSAQDNLSPKQFMATADVGGLKSDLAPGMTVEERYQSKEANPRHHDPVMPKLNALIAREGWDPGPLEILNGDLLTDGHHRYAAARERGIKQLPVIHWGH